MSTLALVLVWLACDGDKSAATDSVNPTGETDADTDADSDADADADTDTDTDTDPGLPEVRDSMSRDAEGCQDLGGTPVAGARAWFYGQYNLDGSGVEIWYLFANDTWKSQGGFDCEVMWNTRWTEATPSVCSGCELGVDTSATVVTASSTCDPGLYAGDETFSAVYEVDLGDDGTSRWFFQSSGEQFASGYANAAAMSYLSEPTCQWFGG